jgi:uncharacterized protein (TIGR00369 family)
VNGLAFVEDLVNVVPMPMASLYSFELRRVEFGRVCASARPSRNHYNPFGVVQGGFASGVLDMALGLVSISVLSGNATSVATADIAVRYLRPIYESTGVMQIEASTLHQGRTTIVAQAVLSDGLGTPYALAQSSSAIVFV